MSGGLQIRCLGDCHLSVWALDTQVSGLLTLGFSRMSGRLADIVSECQTLRHSTAFCVFGGLQTRCFGDCHLSVWGFDTECLGVWWWLWVLGGGFRVYTGRFFRVYSVCGCLTLNCASTLQLFITRFVALALRGKVPG